MLNIRLAFLLRRSFSTIDRKQLVENDDVSSITRKIRLLGLRSNQTKAALNFYDDFIYRQKKKGDLKFFTSAIQCAMIEKNLIKGKEIHRFIEENHPEFIENLILKQQLRLFYVKCNDQKSAEKLFQKPSQ